MHDGQVTYNKGNWQAETQDTIPSLSHSPPTHVDIQATISVVKEYQFMVHHSSDDMWRQNKDWQIGSG